MKLPAPRPRPAAAAVSKRKTPGALIDFDALVLSAAAAAVEEVWSSVCLKGLTLRGLVGWPWCEGAGGHTRRKIALLARQGR